MSIRSDLQRWHAAWRALGGEPAYGFELYDELTRCYAETGRAYHTLDHVRDCLAELEAAQGLAERPVEIECALWFHDAIYEPGEADNEARSAAWAARALRAGGAGQAVAGRVAALILATRHPAATPPSSADLALVADVDLSILGRPLAEYDAYARGIRREYAALPDAVYRQGRAEVLRAFLAQERVYRTAFFYARYEAPARRNLARELSSL
jgi:predicted metal-dependent HD superfamily phosphohydrolase